MPAADCIGDIVRAVDYFGSPPIRMEFAWIGSVLVLFGSDESHTAAVPQIDSYAGAVLEPHTVVLLVTAVEPQTVVVPQTVLEPQTVVDPHTVDEPHTEDEPHTVVVPQTVGTPQIVEPQTVVTPETLWSLHTSW